jgi:hypothetical protein
MNMKQSDTHPQSLAARVLSLSLALLMLPLSARGYAQTTISQSIPTGVSLTDSNGGITEVKPSEPIQPITNTSVIDGDTPEKLIADIDVAMSSLDLERDKIPKPDYSSTSGVLSENLNFLKTEISTRGELIKRIDALMEKGQPGSPSIQNKYKTILTEYRSRLSETLKTHELCFANMDYELKKRSKEAESHKADLSVASETPRPSPTPSSTPWYKTDTAKEKYLLIGSAAALGFIAVLQEWGKKAVDNAMSK